MATDPFTGTNISPGARTVHCPHGHVHLPDSWQAAGNKCCYPGCDYIGNPIGGSSGRGWLWLILLLTIALGGWGIAQSSTPRPQPAPAPRIVLVTATSRPVVAPTQPQSTRALPTPQPVIVITRAPVAVPTDNPLPALQATLERFAAIKTQATRNLDGSQYSTVLRGSALDYYVNAIDTLRNNNCYWIFGRRSIHVDSWQSVNVNYAIVLATIQEDAQLYCNNQLDHGSYDAPYRVRFDLERVNGRWYIVSRTVL
jgi:hypothetical protein